MNPLDVVIAVAAVVALVAGWRMGFLTRAFGWAGAAGGFVLAIVLVPRLIDWIDADSRAVVVLVGVLASIFVVSVGQSIGSAIGRRLRPRSERGGAHAADSLGGAALGVAGVVVLVWVLVPVLAGADGWAASLARNSRVAQLSTEYLPAPPPALADIERRLADGNFPQIFAGIRPAPELPPPPEGSTIGAEALARLAASTVRIEGRACENTQTGSGWMVAPGLVATNAHVVAGTSESRLIAPDGTTATGEVVAFDPAIDLALIRTDLDRPVLPTADPQRGDRGLVLGFPGGGSLDPSPFSVGDLLDARGYDIYDRDQVERSLVVLASDLAPGDSGSAVVRDDGSVIAMSVAIAPDRPGVAYAVLPADLQSLAARSDGSTVDTGPCLR
ncbi:MAG: MarP family serine protease [Microthrixaceae bacterium]